ncbi:PhnB protein [Paenibacillus sp. yr247]|uniref:hypothetical protein n=1 Tax=Paenibacillus sp. yr247 TaxID=1761880 RepID=UPI000890472F|nr:hypothetical protein [Paenibacillus sp. yr247]SDO03073.1 PhnB protein [Paenibacillus sp. yr247]
MATLTPYFYSSDARKQADFYVKALGGEIVSLRTFADMPDADESLKNRVMHFMLLASDSSWLIRVRKRSIEAEVWI